MMSTSNQHCSKRTLTKVFKTKIRTFLNTTAESRTFRIIRTLSIRTLLFTSWCHVGDFSISLIRPFNSTRRCEKVRMFEKKKIELWFWSLSPGGVDFADLLSHNLRYSLKHFSGGFKYRTPIIKLVRFQMASKFQTICPDFGGRWNRVMYVQYLQGIQPNVPAHFA